MKRRAKLYLIAAIAVGLTTVLAGTVLGPDNYEYCQHEDTQYEHCAAYHVAPYLALKSGAFLDAHNGIIAALAGAAVAVFTFTLWRSTHKLWVATQETANIAKRTLTELERPYLFVLNLRPLQLAEGDAHQALALYDVANYGKTPAIIESVKTGYYSTKDTAKRRGLEPDDNAIVETHVIAPGEIIRDVVVKSRPHIPLIAVVDLDRDTSVHLPQFWHPTEGLVVQIGIKYAGPFSADHETAAYWRFSDSTKSFVRYGGKTKNYTK